MRQAVGYHLQHKIIVKNNVIKITVGNVMYDMYIKHITFVPVNSVLRGGTISPAFLTSHLFFDMPCIKHP